MLLSLKIIRIHTQDTHMHTVCLHFAFQRRFPVVKEASRTMAVTNQSSKVVRYLNGLVNIYKPACVSFNRVRNTIIHNICRDLNELQVRAPRKMIDIARDPDANTYSVETKPDLADDVLVVGPRHQMDDFKCRGANRLGYRSSGVFILGLNGGTRTASSLAEGRPVRVYRVTGFLGKATESHFDDSRVTVRHSIDHIYEEKISRLLSSMQSSHQKKMFDLSGVAIDSQAAFELAAKGPIRPAETNMPLIYSIKLVDLRKPFFTLEIHCINESEEYLGLLVHEIALDMKSVAHCTAVRCIRYGHFSLDTAVLRHQWNLQSLITSMSSCNQILTENPGCLRQNRVELERIRNRAEL